MTLLLIDKPFAMTSFQVIAAVRRQTGVKKVGHAGTLDPRATGLLLVAVGRESTKQLTQLIGLDKEYETEVLLGERRSTGDLEGEVVEEKSYQGDVSRELVEAALKSLVGSILLPVSAYSAIKKGGVPFYKKARQAALRGEMIPEAELPKRAMVVYEALLFGIEKVADRLIIKVRFKVGSGTYIRSLGEELGRRLGYPATLKSLRRTRVGEYQVVDAHDLIDYLLSPSK